MATKPFTRFVEQRLGKLPLFVMSVVLEWVLIIVLFLEGFLALVANELAEYFELEIPCWLCTRMAHVLAHKTPDFYYNNSLCEPHKKEVSSLAFCSNHKKLSDIRKMCEGCLLSFATGKESDCETYKSLLGILQKDLEYFVEDGQRVQLILKDEGVMHAEKSRTRRCACCGAPSAKSSFSKGRNSGSHLRAPTASPRAHPIMTSRNDESGALELPCIRSAALKLLSENEDGNNAKILKVKLREEAKGASLPPLAEAEELNNETTPRTTPSFTKANRFFSESPRSPTLPKGNKFFWLPISDSPSNSPKLAYKKSPLEKTELASESIEGNTQSRFFWVPISDSTSTSPRWSNRKSPLEKTEFASDSNEGNGQNEADDATLNNLKRQVHLDHKSLMALCMELDEERNASAIAANNAMAMITRLQEEKAALHMDALQYQRMMEEQIEYDEENLQATNDMLAKLEEEVKALEAELEMYRNRYGSLTEDDLKEAQSSNGGNSSQAMPIEGEDNGENDLNSQQADSSHADNEEGKLNETLKDFKLEKTYLLGRMKKPENRTPLESGVHSLQNKNVDNETGNVTDTR